MFSSWMKKKIIKQEMILVNLAAFFILLSFHGFNVMKNKTVRDRSVDDTFLLTMEAKTWA